MSRQQKRADERRRGKRLRKICLAAGEGVSKAVAFSFALTSNAFAAEVKKEEPITLPPVVVQDQNNPYVPPEFSIAHPRAAARRAAIDHCGAAAIDAGARCF